MLFTVDKESLPEFNADRSNRDREKDNKMDAILNALNITDINYEQTDKRKKKGETTTEENIQCQLHYYNEGVCIILAKTRRFEGVRVW